MVPEKLRALYATPSDRQAVVSAVSADLPNWAKGLCAEDSALYSTPSHCRVFKRRATSSAFSLLLNAEMRK